MLLTAAFTHKERDAMSRGDEHERKKNERKNGMRIVAIANDTNKYDHQMLFIIINF